MDKNKVLGFMNSVDATNRSDEDIIKYQQSPQYIDDTVEALKKDKKEECIRGYVKDIYRNAVPIDSELIGRDGEVYDKEMDKFIDSQCPNGMLMYITDCKSPVMKRVASAINEMVEKNYNTMRDELMLKRESVGSIDKADVDMAKKKADSANKTDMEKVARAEHASEVSSIIQKAVKDQIAGETSAEKTRRDNDKKVARKTIEELKAVTRDQVNEAVEIASWRVNREDEKPSLFEAILLNKMGDITNESVDTDDIMVESICEYTKHRVWKTLRLAEYDRPVVESLVHYYLGS